MTGTARVMGCFPSSTVFDRGPSRLGLRSRACRPPAAQPETECILVVNDDPQTLHHVRDALAGAGYSPLVTGDHRERARIVRAEQPALVLLHLMLPGADGIELMQTVPELSRSRSYSSRPKDRDGTVARALEAGAADYIVKPFSPTELRPAPGQGGRVRGRAYPDRVRAAARRAAYIPAGCGRNPVEGAYPAPSGS